MNSINKILESEKPAKWLFCGDSITHGVYHTFGMHDYVQIFEARVRWELKRYTDIVIRTATTNWTTQSILDNIEWCILQFQPDVVSLMIGMNDANCLTLDQFIDNYHQILDIIKSKTKSEIIIHTPNTIIPNSDTRREQELPAIVEEIRAIGKEYNLMVIDHYAEYSKARTDDPRRTYSWMSDSIHPNVMGHKAFARLIFKELNIWDENTQVFWTLIP